MMTNSPGLLHTRRFLPLFITQFFGALNDNVLKNALVVLLAFNTAHWSSLRPEVLANLAAGVFIVPFFLFSASAGQLADKFDKAYLARLVKILEILIMLLAGVGFALHSLIVLFTALFLLGCHSTLFGPIKYAILPQHLQENELVGGNALIEAGTFVAILLGTLLGGLLAGLGEYATQAITLVGLLLAIAGYLASLAIPSAAAPAPQLSLNPNIASEIMRTSRLAYQNRSVFHSILGISWFWLYGLIFLSQFPVFAKQYLQGSEATVTLLLTVFTLGIGIGSLACERLSAQRIELGLVPFGAIGIILFGLDFAWAAPGIDTLATINPLRSTWSVAALLTLPMVWRLLIDLLLIGIFGGFFIVPLYALVQARAQPEARARIIAANNIYNALFMTVGTLVAAAYLNAGFSIPGLIGVTTLMHAAVALYIFLLVPEFLLRFLAWLLVHSRYRLRPGAITLLPEQGPALLRCAASRPITPLIMSAAVTRPLRFVVEPQVLRQPLIGFFLRHSHAIVLSEDRRSEVQLAIEMALQEGALVAVLANNAPLPELAKTVPEFSVSIERTSKGLWSQEITLEVRALDHAQD